MPELIVDAGPLYALMDEDDSAHGASVALLSSYPGPLVVPTLVVAEVAYLAGVRLGPHAEVAFSADLAAGTFQVDPVAPADWMRVAELVTTYRDFPLGIADASVIACAERRRVAELATLDHRHFAAVRPAHVDAFRLLPDLP